ncbi:hypothetical protein FHR23_001801 [Stakelama sediminis]|uniref:Dolichyl-phosphate-mannose-protein mannosyltransferase n=1 Tax=Stakelama sediminis TaxID=463200 RepID=A0A840YYW4_9SPHN|nr:glycosyltransferase [Stakelama sediminis]MBB5718878.1 hypothetical protein [Stakelama sediminis]
MPTLSRKPSVAFGVEASISPVTRSVLSVLYAALTLYAAFSAPALIGEYGFSHPAWLLLGIWLGALALAIPIARHAPSRLGIALLGTLCVALRLDPLFHAWNALPGGDARLYPEIARHLLDGRGFYVYEPVIGMRMVAFYPPAYAMLLAGWGAIAGLSAASLFVLNLLFDAMAAWLIARLGKRLGRPGAGRAAAWSYLIWPSTLLAAPFAQKEALCIILVLGLVHVWFSAATSRQTTWKAVAAIGILTGLLALTQPGWATLSLLIGLVLVPQAGLRKILRAGIPAAGVTMLVMLPWWVRNAIQLHAFVPLTSAGGVSLWVGNNPGATGDWLPTPIDKWHAHELGYAHDTARLASQWIAANPLEFMRLTATKFVRALGVEHAGVVRMAALSPAPSGSLLATLLPLAVLPYVALLGATSAALGVLRQRLPPILPLLLLAGIAQCALFGVWFEFGERHRLFLLPLMLLACACVLFPQREQGKTA